MSRRRKFEYFIDAKGCFIITSHKISNQKKAIVTVKDDKKLTAAHYIYEECFGKIPEGLVVRHKCDNTNCINPEHMETGTYLDNIRDKVERNRTTAGEKNAGCKLTIEQAKEIKGLQGIEPIGKVAQRYGIGTTQIWRIWTGENWKAVI